MTSQTGQQIITIHTFPITQEVNAIMQWNLVKCEKYFLKFRNHAENKIGWLVPDFFLFFKKALCKI